MSPLSIRQTLVLSVLTHLGCIVGLGWPPIAHPWRLGLNCFLAGSYLTSFIIFGTQRWISTLTQRRAKQILRPDPRLN